MTRKQWSCRRRIEIYNTQTYLHMYVCITHSVYFTINISNIYLTFVHLHIIHSERPILSYQSRIKPMLSFSTKCPVKKPANMLIHCKMSFKKTFTVASDVKQLEQALVWWGNAPYERYTLLLWIFWNFLFLGIIMSLRKRLKSSFKNKTQ